MRIVFVGSVQFSKILLEHLIEMNAEVVGICTLKSSASNADHSDLSALADQYGIPWVYSPDINSQESEEWINSKNPDVIFCFGWSRLIKSRLLKIPPLGILGYHPTLLPQNRGRHPIIWALVLGLVETGSTFFFMGEGADDGDIASQKIVPIDYEDDAMTLYGKLAMAAKAQLTELVPKLESNTFTKTVQDVSKANTWRKRTADDGLIDWSSSDQTIRNLVRALTHPYVGAHFFFEGLNVKVWEVQVLSSFVGIGLPGEIVGTYDGFSVVACGTGFVALTKTEPTFSSPIGTYL